MTWLGQSDAALEASGDLDDAIARIRAVHTVDPAVREARDRILELIADRPDAASRDARPGHLTGSAAVVDATGAHTALLFHAKLQRWLQPGGHADGDMNLAAVALREAREETGIDDLVVDPEPIDLDVHRVAPPGEDPHLHLDVRFVVMAPPGARLVANHESTDLRWVRWSELDRYEPDPGLRRLARAARGRIVPISPRPPR